MIVNKMDVSVIVIITVISSLYAAVCGADTLKNDPPACDKDLNVCYYLYGGKTNLQYVEAFSRCSDLGYKLATIPTQAHQNVITGIAHSDGEVLVWPWLAATRSKKDDLWHGIGDEIYKDVINFERSSNFKCSAFRASKQSNLDNYYAVPCLVPQGPSERKLQVCEANKQNGICPNGFSEVPELNECLAIPRNWTNTAFFGNNMCVELLSGSTLAHTSIRHPKFKDFVRDNIGDITGRFGLYPDVWLGVSRNPWVWVPDGPDGSEVMIKYTNWRQDAGQVVGDDCLIMDIKWGAWRDVSCTQPHYFYLCQGPYKTDDTTTSEGSSGISGLSQTSIIIIACVAVGLLLLIIIIVLILVVVKRRKTKNRATRRPDDNYHRNISEPVDKRNSNQPNGSTPHRDLSMRSIPDATNRELTPMDFNILWSSVKDKRSSTAGSTASDTSSNNRRPTKGSQLYANDGFDYEHV